MPRFMLVSTVCLAVIVGCAAAGPQYPVVVKKDREMARSGLSSTLYGDSSPAASLEGVDLLTSGSISVDADDGDPIDVTESPTGAFHLRLGGGTIELPMTSTCLTLKAYPFTDAGDPFFQLIGTAGTEVLKVLAGGEVQVLYTLNPTTLLESDIRVVTPDKVTAGSGISLVKDNDAGTVEISATGGGGGGSVNSVTAGTGLTDSGTATDPVLNVTYGTGSGTAAQGNDSRLSDARTPTSHAASHKSGGGDSIKLDELAAPTDITTLNASTSAHGLLPKLGGGTTNFFRADGTWSAPPSAPAETFRSAREYYGVVRGGSNTYDAIGLSGWTLTSTSNADTANGAFLLLGTTSGAGAVARVAGSATQLRADWDPDFQWKINSNSLTLLNHRVFVGLSTAGSDMTGADSPSVGFIGFRYSTTATNGNWFGVVTNGTTPTELDLGVTYAVNTVYLLRCNYDSTANTASFYIDGTLVGTITGASNPGSTGVTATIQLRNIAADAAGKNFRCGTFILRQGKL